MSHFFPFVINPRNDIVKKNPLLLVLAEQLSQDYTQHIVTETNLKTIGTLLWQSLQLDELFDQLYQKYLSLALVIQSQSQSVHALPWECLYHPTFGFLAKHENFTLSRCLSNKLATEKAVISTPIRILLITLPHADLQLEWEQHEIYQVLQGLIIQGQVQLSICDNGSFADFQALLRKQSWHLVLLSGHYVISQSIEKNFFVFQDEQDQRVAVDIVPLFQQVHCVILSACQTAQFLQPSPLASQLIQVGVSHVIAMREVILDRAAVIFMKNFCLSLLQQARIDVAVQHGRQKLVELLNKHEVWQSGQTYQGQWGLPMLLTSNPNTELSISMGKNVSIPVFLSNNLPAFPILIGRRKEVQQLFKLIKFAHYAQFIIYGDKGIGKSTLVAHLVNRLYIDGYHIFACQANSIDELEQYVMQWLQITNFEQNEILMALTRLQGQKWILWIDQINITHYMNMSFLFKQVSYLPYFRVLMTSRNPFTAITSCYHHHVSKLDFEDFARYLYYLGMSYESIQIRLLYRIFDGHFKAVELLQTMPIQPVGRAFMQQLKIVKRYLQAYLKNKDQ